MKRKEQVLVVPEAWMLYRVVGTKPIDPLQVVKICGERLDCVVVRKEGLDEVQRDGFFMSPLDAIEDSKKVPVPTPAPAPPPVKAVVQQDKPTPQAVVEVAEKRGPGRPKRSADVASIPKSRIKLRG